MKIIAWLSRDMDASTMSMLADSLTDKYYFTVEDDSIVIVKVD